MHPRDLLKGWWCARPGRWPPPRPHSCRDLERRVVVELAALPLAVGGALGLGGGPAQGWGDLVRLDLDHRALVTLRRLPEPGLEPADDHCPVALGQRVGDVLGQLPPHVDPEERGLSVLPGVAVLDAAVTARRKLATSVPLGVYRRSGSSVRLPVMVTWVSAMSALLGARAATAGWLGWRSGR